MNRFKALIVPLALLLPVLVIAQPLGGRGQGKGNCCVGPGGATMGPRHEMKMKHARHGAMRMRLATKLKMTDIQKTKMDKIRTDFQLLMVDQQAKVRKAQIQLRVLRHDDQAAVTAVESQIDQVGKLRAEVAKLRYRHHAEMKSVLTDKQKELLKDLRKERPGGMHGMMFPDDIDGDYEAPEPDGEEG